MVQMVNDIFYNELYFVMTPERRLEELCDGMVIKKITRGQPRVYYKKKGEGIVFEYYKHKNARDSFYVKPRISENLMWDFNLTARKLEKIILKFAKNKLGIESKIDIYFYL